MAGSATLHPGRRRAPAFALLIAVIGLAVAAAHPIRAQALDTEQRTLADEHHQAEDQLILRDGSMQNGQLVGCVAGGCTLDDVSVSRERIEWIGLRAEELAPPVPRGAVDEVHLRDGSVHPGRLVEISQEDVATEGGRHPRDAVAWIHLAEDKPAVPGPPRGNAEHLYEAFIEVNVVEKLDYRDSAADTYPPCEIGTAERRVRWAARLPARYSRVDLRELMEAVAKQAEAAGVPQEAWPFDNNESTVTEVLSSDRNGETAFDIFEEEVDQKWFVWAEGMCTFEGSYQPHTCRRSLTGKPLSIQLGWSPETGRVLASNGGPDIDGFIDICSASYLNVGEFQPDWASTQFSGSRALFDAVSIEPSAADVERLRAGEEVILRGGVRFKDLSECCVGQTFARIGAEFDVQATAEIRLIPRR